MITCAAPPTVPVAAALAKQPAQSKRRDIDMQRPVLRVARKPAPKQSPVRTICTEPPAAGAAPGPMAPLMLPAADALPVVASLPPVPAAPAEPLEFDPPRAGPTAERTFSLASAPPPPWWPVVVPWNMPGAPVVPEPPTWLLVVAGLALLIWRKTR